MALIICHECRGSVSSEAKVCPGCGAKVKIPKLEKKPYSKTSLRILYGILILVFVVGPIYRGVQYMLKSPEQIALEEKQKQEAAVQRAAQKVAEEKAATLQLNREKAGTLTALAIRNTSRNPNSVIWDSITVNDDYSVVCVELRAENGFGGINRESIVGIDGKIISGSKAWNKYCAGKTMHDVTSKSRNMLKGFD